MNGRKAFTVEADEELSKKFSAQVVKRGYTKYRAIEGALRLWLTIDPHQQVELIEDKPKPEADVPSDDEIYDEIQKLGEQWKVTSEKIRVFLSAGGQVQTKTRLRRKKA